MRDFSITMPIGQISIVMAPPRLIDRIAHQTVRGELVHHAQFTPDPETSMYVEHAVPSENGGGIERKVAQLKQVMNLQQALRSEGMLRSEAMYEALRKMMVERFKEHASKKNVEFYVPDLSLEKVEELGYRYMENMGSENGTLVIFKLSEYHKFAALVDDEAFRIYRNENGTHAELVEIAPHKWVLGRYDNDLTMIKQMEGMRMYQPGTNSDE